jgi:hypothetical protein
MKSNWKKHATSNRRKRKPKGSEMSKIKHGVSPKLARKAGNKGASGGNNSDDIKSDGTFSNNNVPPDVAKYNEKKLQALDIRRTAKIDIQDSREHKKEANCKLPIPEAWRQNKEASLYINGGMRSPKGTNRSRKEGKKRFGAKMRQWQPSAG